MNNPKREGVGRKNTVTNSNTAKWQLRNLLPPVMFSSLGGTFVNEEKLSLLSRAVVDSLRAWCDSVNAQGAEGKSEKARLIQELKELASSGGLHGPSLSALVERLLLQRPCGTGKTRIAYQGVDGCYSSIAARHYMDEHGITDIELQGYDSFSTMLEAVREDKADYGFLPIENTTAGSINDAYDLLAHMNLTLVGEQKQRIDHCLISLQPIAIEDIRYIFSHPQALAQCSRFLTSLTNCHVEAFVDTAMAVKKIKEDGDVTQAAIASSEAAKLYGLHIVSRNINNHAENYTRFVVASRAPVPFGEEVPCKTSLIFAIRHEEGALVRCLQRLASRHLNLTKLESRPRPGTPWEYLFYVDFEGNVANEQVKEALRDLAIETSFLKVLGSYPKQA
jgi:chorismate mutase/prephenate dehydratase